MDLSNFNITEYRKYIHKECLKLGMSYEEREQSVLDVLEKGKNQFSATCKTCGVNFKLNNLEHICKQDDISLYNYTNRSLENREIPTEHYKSLKQKYPLEAINVEAYAYRGLNFLTKKHYDMFLSEIKDGCWDLKSITSWTIKKSSAIKFAKVIQKGTSLNDEDRKNVVVEAFKSKANITGYKGVIIRTVLKDEFVLADINFKKFGNYAEHEVVLLPGKYKIEVIDTFDRIDNAGFLV